MDCAKFYINKFSYLKEEIPDISFIPMLMRRKLDKIGKAGLYTLYNSHIENIEHKLLFASTYGDIDRVLKLIEQRQREGEISPAGFSFSVHNATIGLFSLLNSIKTSYNSVSAGDNTLDFGILEAILSCTEMPLLFCYAESYEELKSIAFSCSKEPISENAFEIIFEQKKNKKEDSFDTLVDFFNNKVKTYNSTLYTLKRG